MKAKNQNEMAKGDRNAKVLPWDGISKKNDLQHFLVIGEWYWIGGYNRNHRHHCRVLQAVVHKGVMEQNEGILP